MDSEMIERVAEGLWKDDNWHSNFKSITENHKLWLKKKYFIKQAKAAIKAMREPTDKMLGAIHGCYPDIPDKHALIVAKDKWQEAIDTVIND